METKIVGNFTDWNTFDMKFADCFGIELTPNARGTQVKTLYIWDGKLCCNTVVASTSMRSASIQDRPLSKHCQPATLVTPAAPARPKRRSIGLLTLCHRESA